MFRENSSWNYIIFHAVKFCSGGFEKLILKFRIRLYWLFRNDKWPKWPFNFFSGAGNPTALAHPEAWVFWAPLFLKRGLGVKKERERSEEEKNGDSFSFTRCLHTCCWDGRRVMLNQHFFIKNDINSKKTRSLSYKKIFDLVEKNFLEFLISLALRQSDNALWSKIK